MKKEGELDRLSDSRLACDLIFCPEMKDSGNRMGRSTGDKVAETLSSFPATFISMPVTSGPPPGDSFCL